MSSSVCRLPILCIARLPLNWALTSATASCAKQSKECHDVYAGTMQGSQQPCDRTPAYAQSAVQTTPAAPQRQSKAAVSATALTGLQKMQLHTPAREGAEGSDAKEMAGTAEQTGKAGQTDVKALIHEEFAILMATKTLTPNEAAILAVKKVTQQQSANSIC